MQSTSVYTHRGFKKQVSSLFSATSLLYIFPKRWCRTWHFPISEVVCTILLSHRLQHSVWEALCSMLQRAQDSQVSRAACPTSYSFTGHAWVGTGMGPVSREQFGSEMTATRELHIFLLVCARSQQPGRYLCAVLSSCYNPGSLLTKLPYSCHSAWLFGALWLTGNLWLKEMGSSPEALNTAAVLSLLTPLLHNYKLADLQQTSLLTPFQSCLHQVLRSSLNPVLWTGTRSERLQWTDCWPELWRTLKEPNNFTFCEFLLC